MAEPPPAEEPSRTLAARGLSAGPEPPAGALASLVERLLRLGRSLSELDEPPASGPKA